MVMVYGLGGGVVSRENFPPHGKETKKGKVGLRSQVSIDDSRPPVQI